ncbi:MAG TPA: M48 family metallopeptidase, partial [bacterium]|nr:M48 family metallopeptidase [bacterium]
ALLGLPLLYAVYGFMAWTGRAWWLWLLAFLTAVQIGLVWLYPTWIAPWFNRYVELPAGDLRQRLEALARGAGFRPRGIFVVDASRRSGHSNAYFTGFFRPRIVLFDTLLQRLGLEEALAVLAHEMGHFKKRHIHKALLLNLLGQAVGLLVLQWAVRWPPLFGAFGFATPALHTGLALFMLAGGCCTFFLSPLWAWFSRRNEYAADTYALAVSGQPQALKAALLRLSQDNLSNLVPHPWYSFYHYSHPVLTERLAAIDRQASSLAPASPRPASA